MEADWEISRDNPKIGLPVSPRRTTHINIDFLILYSLFPNIGIAVR